MNEKVISFNSIKAEKSYKEVGMEFNYNAVLDNVHNRKVCHKDLESRMIKGYMKMWTDFYGGENEHN